MCEACREFVHAMHGQEDRNEKLRSETELELARIRRDEAIALAKISQKMNEDDNDAALIAAEVASEIQADVIDELTETEPDVVIMQNDSEPATEELPEEEMAEAPPEVEEVSVPRSKPAMSYWP